MSIQERNAHIASFAVAPAPYIADQATAEEFMRSHYSDRLTSRSLSIIHTLFSHPSIKKRHFAIERIETLVDEEPDARIARFTHWSAELTAQVIQKALAQAGANVSDVIGLVVNTCTGYICPGISTYLIEKLGLSHTIRAYDLVGSGCGGAIPNLQVAESLLGKNGDGVVVSASVEICSATLQVDNDISLILSNTLFGDGAAAAVLSNRPEGFEMVASAGRYVPELREMIRYIHKNGQLYNQLSLKLPQMIKKAAASVVADVLKSRSLAVCDVKHWAVHTGGEKIINAVRDEIGIPEERVQATRTVLAEYGNMSSPTVWFVLDELEQQGITPGEWCVMLAFGAGLSAHAFLFQKR
ncbi:MAG: type III polyketide synthase [Deltaproteobacteria bacterium]|nr:type III polyketide synthase [Deltaproteobacteria bacterium]